ncbi:MAG: hypothetical protein BECKG1743D_GA0114223_112832 [Candidatus Kentron sp. G]|nr:MAG: hypothetical protein BECKG1743D_GA0114223_112832 [Candidatus Kentron sp. G]
MTNKAISIKEYTNLLVFIVQLLRCNNSYIVNDAPAARLESERKSCAIWYILFCQSPKHLEAKTWRLKPLLKTTKGKARYSYCITVRYSQKTSLCFLCNQ